MRLYIIQKHISKNNEKASKRIVEKNSIVKCKVPTENGPICCTAFPALYYSPTKDTIYENIYEGKIVDNKGNVVYMNFIKDYFVERQDVWYTGFIMKDGAFEKLNPAQLSPEHNKLIKNIVHTYETLEEEYSMEIKK